MNQRASAAVRRVRGGQNVFAALRQRASSWCAATPTRSACAPGENARAGPAGLRRARGTEDIDGVACDHWVDDLGANRIHIYMAPSPANKGNERVPRRLTDEQVLDGESVPLMTYDWKDLVVGPIADNNGAAATQTWFDIPQPYDWRSCSRYLGGFPYLHIFHHYLRF